MIYSEPVPFILLSDTVFSCSKSAEVSHAVQSGSCNVAIDRKESWMYVTEIAPASPFAHFDY